jgi:hypothetical protein
MFLQSQTGGKTSTNVRFITDAASRDVAYLFTLAHKGTENLFIGALERGII